MLKIIQVRVSAGKNLAEVFWQDGHLSRFHSCWLRFNCRCDSCRKTVVGQSTLDRGAFPDQLLINKIEINKEQTGIYLWMDGDIKPDHVTFMDADWLRHMCYCDQCLCNKISARNTKFVGSSIVPRIDYKEMKSDEGAFRMLRDVFEVGFVVISNVPCEEGSVVKVGENLAPIIDQTYGKIFDVKDLSGSENYALSSKGLVWHTDQCHYESAPGVQMLHAIQFDDCVEGGLSQLVDMFEAIEILRRESPDDFMVLTRVPCPFSTIDYERRVPVYLITRKPIIHVDYDDQVTGFNWNAGTEDILQVHEDDVEPFYRAYKKLQRITRRNELKFEFRLKTGDLLLFNNRRMIHSRSAFKSNGGIRRLQGCYINSEELRSKYVILGRKLGKEVVIRKIGNRSAI